MEIVGVASKNRPPRGGLIPRQRLFDKFVLFNQGSWIPLLIEVVNVAKLPSTRRDAERTKGRERAQMMVMMGEVSSGRQVLEGAPLAPGTDTTLRQLPTSPRASKAFATRNHWSLARASVLFGPSFVHSDCAVGEARGAGPSGVTAEHLKPILDSARNAEVLCQAAELMARASIPEEVLKAIRKVRMTALQKPTGGVRGTVAGDIIWRPVSRTMGHQIRKKVE